MRSFFNKPSWASRGDEDGKQDFYRRAGQTYKDIITTNKIARDRPARSVSSYDFPGDGSTRGFDNGKEAVDNRTDPLGISTSPHDASQHEINHDNPAMAQQVSSSDDTMSTDPEGTAFLGHRALSRSQFPSFRAESTSLSSTHMTSNEKTDAHAVCPPQDTRIPSETGTYRSDRNSAYDNAVVEILITSKIATTKPLIIQRKMSQPLKGVRLAWCTHQKLPKELHPAVFLTWKGRRLFDVTTCRSLNIDVHSAFTKEISSFDDLFSDTDHIRIHVEAVTEEVFTPGYGPSPNTAGSDPTPPAFTELQDVEQHAQSKIILKCPGFDDFRIRVAHDTNISRAVAAFCEARNISPELEVYLAFDGDRLDPQSRFADYEITDGDLIDVLMKKAV